MSLRINNNVESLNAHRHLINNDKQLSKSIERLSSGQKINRGADGPASLVISEGMRAQLGSLQQRLGRDAAPVQADATQVLFFDTGYRQAQLGRANRCRVAAGARPDHDEVELIRHGCSLKVRAPARGRPDQTSSR